MLSIEGKILFIQVVTFAIGAGLIYLIYLRPLARFLRARKQGIARDLSASEQARLQAAKWKEEGEAAQARMAEEQRVFLEKARVEAEQARQELLRQACQEQKALLLAGRLQMEEERRETLRQIQAEAIALVIQATEKFLEKNLDQAAQRLLAHKAMASISTSLRAATGRGDVGLARGQTSQVSKN